MFYPTLILYRIYPILSTALEKIFGFVSVVAERITDRQDRTDRSVNLKTNRCAYPFEPRAISIGLRLFDIRATNPVEYDILDNRRNHL